MQAVTTINITRIVPRWDRDAGVLWLDLTCSDGKRYSVGFPVGHYAGLLCHYLQQQGVVCQPEIGEDLESVDGLFGFIKRVARKASRAVKKATRKVSRRISRVARTAVRAARRGVRTVSRGVKRYGATALKVAASGASFVPGVGTAVASGLAGAAALAQGKSWAQVAKEAAMGALPGGPMAQAALQAGYGVASGQRVDRALLAGVQRAVPGGAAGQAIFNASLAVARGKRPDRAIKAAAVQTAMRHVPAQYRRAAAGAMAVARGQRVDRAMLGAARQIAAAQVRGKRPDRMFAAISGRGLSALAGTNKAAHIADRARQAHARMRAGRATTQDKRAIMQARAMKARMAAVARSRNPFARMVIAGMRTQPGAARHAAAAAGASAAARAAAARAAARRGPTRYFSRWRRPGALPGQR